MEIRTTEFEDGNPLGTMVELIRPEGNVTVVGDSREAALEELVRELHR